MSEASAKPLREASCSDKERSKSCRGQRSLNGEAKLLVGGIYHKGINWLRNRIESKAMRRLANSVCVVCKDMGYKSFYWNCLECQFAWFLINVRLLEIEATEGAVQRVIQNEITDQFSRINRHTRLEIRNARTLLSELESQSLEQSESNNNDK